TTDRGTYRALRAILAAGAWLAPLAPDLGVPLVVERQVIHWLTPRRHPERVTARHLPVAIWEYEPGRMFYVIPDVGDGLKAALHHQGPTVDPDAPAVPASEREQADVLALVERFVPDAAGIVSESATCLYTNTPDGHFIVDAYPGAPDVLVPRIQVRAGDRRGARRPCVRHRAARRPDGVPIVPLRDALVSRLTQVDARHIGVVLGAAVHDVGGAEILHGQPHRLEERDLLRREAPLALALEQLA